MVRKPSALTLYGRIEGLFLPSDEKSPHERRDDAQRAAGHVAWSPAGQQAGFPDGRYFPDAGRAHHLGRTLGRGLVLVDDGLGEQGVA